MIDISIDLTFDKTKFKGEMLVYENVGQRSFHSKKVDERWKRTLIC